MLESSGAKVLVIDDEPGMLENLDRLLTAEGYRCATLGDSRDAKNALQQIQPDVLITDLRMPGADGMDVLELAQQTDPSMPILLITGYATVASAVHAIEQGAFDYLAKPFTGEQLLVAVERALRYRRLDLENKELRDQISRSAPNQPVGSSPAFARILDQARRVARTDANVLLTGESGTGKEVLANLIHRESERRNKPFAPVDCAAMPEGLLESELFGHERGAFTGAVAQRRGLLLDAHGGTVFLDEIGELTMSLQAKLLRVLEERQIRHLGSTKQIDVDVRMIAATNKDLDQAVQAGEFREDLYYRLNVVHLRLPPLRARTGDIVLLAREFLREFSERNGKSQPRVDPLVWRVIQQYRWPGNVRQLRNLCEQIIALDIDGRVTLSELPPEIRFDTGNGSAQPKDLTRDLAHLAYDEAREQAMLEFRAQYIEALLKKHGGNVSQAARAAGVNRRTLHRWIAEQQGLHDEA